MRGIGFETVFKMQESLLLLKGMPSGRLESAQERVHTERKVREKVPKIRFWEDRLSGV